MRGLNAQDRYGMAAYLCFVHHTELQPVPGVPGVLECATGRHRTDEPGAGVLGDGFDVIHRQWGLRGDPHVWGAVRELVATTPTPGDPGRIRKAYVDAFRRVVDVDVDQSEESKVYRADLDHGGMWGGWVDLEWWRTKGIPLLVTRAADRRPTSPEQSVGRSPGT